MDKYAVKEVQLRSYKNKREKELIGQSKRTDLVITDVYKADDVADLAKRSKTVIENLLDVLQNTAGLTMSTEFKREIDESIAELGRIAGK